MALTQTLQASFTQSIGKQIVMPPNTKVFAFFGTGGDGIETNRNPGGPTLTVTSGTPVHATNYVSLGHQPAGSPTRYDVIDFGVAQDSTNFPLGFTTAVVARTQAEATNYVECISNQTASSGQGQNPDCLSLQPSTNRLINYAGVGSRGNLTLVNSVSTTWHFIAQTNTGGAAATVTAWEFTENQAGQAATTPYVASGRTANAAMTTHIGSMSVESATTIGPCDIAWAFHCIGPMTQANMAALAAMVRPWLARRGIVM